MITMVRTGATENYAADQAALKAELQGRLARAWADAVRLPASTTGPAVQAIKNVMRTSGAADLSLADAGLDTALAAVGAGRAADLRALMATT